MIHTASEANRTAERTNRAPMDNMDRATAPTTRPGAELPQMNNEANARAASPTAEPTTANDAGRRARSKPSRHEPASTGDEASESEPSLLESGRSSSAGLFESRIKMKGQPTRAAKNKTRAASRNMERLAQKNQFPSLEKRRNSTDPKVFDCQEHPFRVDQPKLSFEAMPDAFPQTNIFDARIAAAQSLGLQADARLLLAKIYWDRDLRPWEKRAALEISNLGYKRAPAPPITPPPTGVFFVGNSESPIPEADFVLAGTFEAFGHRPEGSLGREIYRLTAYPRHHGQAEPFFWTRRQALSVISRGLLLALGLGRRLPGEFSLSTRAAWSRALADAVGDGIVGRIESSNFSILSSMAKLARNNPQWNSSRSLPRELARGIPDFESFAQGRRRPCCSAEGLLGLGALSSEEADAFADAIEWLSSKDRIGSSKFGAQARLELFGLYEESQIAESLERGADAGDAMAQENLCDDDLLGLPSPAARSGPPRL